MKTRRGTIHTLATEPDFEAGEAVTGRIDEEFRTYCTRAHTASHLVYVAGRNLFEDPGHGGFDIRSEKVRLDFETDRDPGDVNARSIVVSDASIAVTARGGLLAGAAGLFAGIGLISMYIGFSQASTTLVSTLGAMYFVVAAVLGIVVLGDDVTITRFAGIAFACLSIVLLTR